MRFLAWIIGAALLAWPAAAQVVKWKHVGGWDVMIDKSLRDGCYIFFSGTRGTIIRIGYTDSRALHWFLAHDAWKSLEVGQVYETSVSIDGRQYNGSMTGRSMGGGVVALTATFQEAAMARQFLLDFMRGNRMSVSWSGRQLALINLQSSYAAGEQLMLCQASIDGTQRNPASGADDPFARRDGQPTQQKDPFRR